jgi:hypothetical protein
MARKLRKHTRLTAITLALSMVLGACGQSNSGVVQGQAIVTGRSGVSKAYLSSLRVDVVATANGKFVASQRDIQAHHFHLELPQGSYHLSLVPELVALGTGVGGVGCTDDVTVQAGRNATVTIHCLLDSVVSTQPSHRG